MARLENLLSLQRLRGKLVALAVPCIILTAYFLGGEIWLLLAALVVPLPLLMQPSDTSRSQTARDRDRLTGFMVGDAFETTIDSVLEEIQDRFLLTACLILELDKFHQIRARHGDSAAEEVLKYTARRISAALRSRDLITRIGDARFAIFLDPVRILDLEVCLQLASRLQTAIEEPVPLQSVSVHPTCSIGFCLSSRLSHVSGRTLYNAADLALAEARRSGPSSARAYHDGMRRRAVTRRRSEKEAEESIDRGQVQAWFQPQISTDTGLVTGFETLARWEHPERGVIPPVEFLPVLEQTGQLERLANRMMSQAFSALCQWDESGFKVPSIGVNFAGDELRNPVLLEKVRWELDRFSITADRLSVEVLESVVAGAPDDMLVRNVNALADLGCRIDLDDFGTGHASISSIRRLNISRLKIDRSFVTRIDQDIEQQRMVSAILTMAERLELDTLAEGVETPGEHAMLAQLGCVHVQGFGIARPMPFDHTIGWLKSYTASLDALPKIGRQTG
ncbi:putative bifunctional diguanylate cyclase/phosphodiesterase [Shimia gijangensis]|nr:bifunctional diguanylate cyclase/phosphodiesterase [Shimia gijangensis]